MSESSIQQAQKIERIQTMTTTALYTIAIDAAQKLVKENPSLQFYVECPDGGHLLVGSNGCLGPFGDAQGDMGKNIYILEIKLQTESFQRIEASSK